MIGRGKENRSCEESMWSQKGANDLRRRHFESMEAESVDRNLSGRRELLIFVIISDCSCSCSVLAGYVCGRCSAVMSGCVRLVISEGGRVSV